jgi:hypothetical protein
MTSGDLRARFKLNEAGSGSIKKCVATRYDKFAANYLAVIKLASIRIWLRAIGSGPLEHRHAATAQAVRNDHAAGVVSLPPRVAIAAALGRDPAAIAVERMGERDRVDGAQQIWKPAQVFGGPDDGGLHFADRAQARQKPDVREKLGTYYRDGINRS